MRKQIIFFLLGICIPLSAQTLVTEDFDYELSASVTSCGSWMLQWGGESAYLITNGLEFPHYAGCGVGNAVLLDSDGSNDQPHLPFAEVTSGDVFVAFMFQPSVVAKKGYFFCLRDNKLTGSDFNFNARVSINADYQLGLTFANNQNAVYSSETLNPQKVYLCVVKYSIVSGTNNDAVSLYVFDSEGDIMSEPAAPTLGPLTDAAKVDINPANVVLRGFDNNGWLVIDGIRVAQTWRDAVEYTDATCGIESGLESKQSRFVADEVVAVYSILGNYVGSSTSALPSGTYIVHTTFSTFKIVK